MSNSFAAIDNVSDAYCSVRENVPGYFTTGRKLWAVLPMLYTKRQILITVLGIYCKNMKHDAWLWYSCGCSVLSPQDLHGVDFIWFSTSVSEWEPHELRHEGSQEPEWAAFSVAVLVCLYSMVAVCADLNHFRGHSVGAAPTSSSFLHHRRPGMMLGVARQLQTSEALGRNVARIWKPWRVYFLTSHIEC